MAEEDDAAPRGALERLAEVPMVVPALEVTLGVVFRTIGRQLVWYDEIAAVLRAWHTFYGSAMASVKRAHIGCPELSEQFAPPTAPRPSSTAGTEARGEGTLASSCSSPRLAPVLIINVPIALARGIVAVVAMPVTHPRALHRPGAGGLLLPLGAGTACLGGDR